MRISRAWGGLATVIGLALVIGLNATISGCQGPATANAAGLGDSAPDDDGTDDSASSPDQHEPEGEGSDGLSPAGLEDPISDPPPDEGGDLVEVTPDLSGPIEACPVSFDVAAFGGAPEPFVRGRSPLKVVGRIAQAEDVLRSVPSRLIYIWRFDDVEINGPAETHFEQPFEFLKNGRHRVGLAVYEPETDERFDCRARLTGETEITVMLMGRREPGTDDGTLAECALDADCDDGMYCNGAETCSAGVCQAGSSPCGGALCDEANDACVECLADSNCNDGLYCNGVERCVGGECVAGGDPCSGRPCDEDGDACGGCSADTECDDGLFCNGVEACVAGRCEAGSGPCDGAYCIEVLDLCVDCLQDADCADDLFCNGSESCVEGTCMPGTVPCADQLCDESADRCADCLDDGDCDDGVFCNGAEGCFSGLCRAGSPPCADQMCDESGERCVACVEHSDCDDGLFCNGSEWCVDGSCVAGSAACTDLLCNESTDSCVDCLDDGDCDDGVFCNGAEVCVSGVCQTGSAPCTNLMCDESGDRCVGCLADSDCDDGLFCNGAELCVDGGCFADSAPCSGQMCDEVGDSCVDCLADADCDDGRFCNGAEICEAGVCLSDSGPCAGQLCDEASDVCVDCLDDGDCNDGLFCNGSETCVGGTCMAGVWPCADGETCDESANTCFVDNRPYFVDGLPLDLRGATPERGELLLTLNEMPAGTSQIELVLTVFDADNPEGRLFVNGNGPINLWGDQALYEHDGVTALLDPIATDAQWYQVGSNTLEFWHDATGGYVVEDLTVNFVTTSVTCVADSECDDGSPCTFDYCDPSNPGANVQGCVFEPIAGCCTDNSDCGTGQYCDANNTCQDGGASANGRLVRGDGSTSAAGRSVTVAAYASGADPDWDAPVASVTTSDGTFSLDVPDGFSGFLYVPPSDADGIRCESDTLAYEPGTEQVAVVFFELHVDRPGDGVGRDGDDGNPGTPGAPFATIQAAMDAALPGDTVLVREGVYSTGTTNQNFVVLNVPSGTGGTEGRPITVKAAEGEDVVIDGTAHGSDSRILVIISGSHVVLEGMEMRNARRTAVDVNAPAHHVTVRLCDVHHNNRDTSFIGGALRGVGPIRHVVFEDCLSHHNSVGIELRESPTQVNSTAHVPPTAGNTGFATDLPESEWDSWEGWTEYAARYCTVRRCVVYDNRLLDEHSDGIMMRYAIDTVFEDNLSFYNGDDNIDGLAATRCVFRGNIAFGANPENTVDGDGNGIKVGVRGGLDNVVARNIAFDNPRGGIDLADTERAEVYNNTVYNNGEWFGIWFEGTRAQVGGMRVLNNVCKHNGTLAGRSDIGVLSGARLLAFDYNSVSDDASGNFAPAPGPHGFTSTDPGFVNESLTVDTAFPAGLTIPQRLAFIRDQVMDKFSLSPGSPLIDEGTHIPGVTDGFSGAGPDLGAVESP